MRETAGDEIGGRVRLPRGYLQRTAEHETRVHSRDIRKHAHVHVCEINSGETRRFAEEEIFALKVTQVSDSVIKNDIDRNRS